MRNHQKRQVVDGLIMFYLLSDLTGGYLQLVWRLIQ